MAKSKRVSKAEPKKFVSTSAIFKHVNRDKSRKEKAYNMYFTVKRKGEKDCHDSTIRKSKKTPDHPLAVEFTCMISKNELEHSMS